jgi:hypothetical protein
MQQYGILAGGKEAKLIFLYSDTARNQIHQAQAE